MEVLRNNGTFFNNLNKKVREEYYAENTRKQSIVNTYQNEPQFQKAQNLSRNYMRTGNAKYSDPFAFHMRPNNFSYDGRKLSLLNTLKLNAKPNFPEVITKNKLNVVGFY